MAQRLVRPPTSLVSGHGLLFRPGSALAGQYQPKSYYKSGRRKDEHQQVLRRILELLNAEACADVRPRIRDSAALSLFAMPMLRAAVEPSGIPAIRHPRAGDEDPPAQRRVAGQTGFAGVVCPNWFKAVLPRPDAFELSACGRRWVALQSHKQFQMQNWLTEYQRAQQAVTAAIRSTRSRKSSAPSPPPLREGKSIYVFGNGGSAANASHFATDLGKALPTRWAAASACSRSTTTCPG